MAQTVKNPLAMLETWIWSSGWEDPLEEGTATHSSILPGESPWTEEPGRVYSPWGRKELDMTEQLSTAQHVKKASFDPGLEDDNTSWISGKEGGVSGENLQTCMCVCICVWRCMRACFGGEGEKSLPEQRSQRTVYGKLNFILQEKKSQIKWYLTKNLLEEKDSNHPA